MIQTIQQVAPIVAVIEKRRQTRPAVYAGFLTQKTLGLRGGQGS